MSLLGKLFSATSSTGQSNARSSNPLDSNLEDHFTYNLLFPDAEALCHKDQLFPFSSGTALSPTNANTFDLNGEIDLEMRDVRVIIMQEATSASGTPYVLYDSHTPPPTSPFSDRQNSNASAFPTRSENRRSISTPRKTSVGQNSRPVVIQQESTTPRALGGAFDRRSTHKPQLSYTETEGQRSAREYKEEVTTISNCIFGNSEVLAYKGTGTKVHILPSESRSCVGPSSYAADGSLGRASMRSSKLVQSFTLENVAGPSPAGLGAAATPSARGQDRKKVMITRMFPVPLPNDEADVQTPLPGGGDKDGYPFPKVSDHGTPERKPQPQQKRTPMYAVGLIISLPASPPRAPSAPTSRSSVRASSSYNEQDSFPSSFSSTKRAGWTMLGSGFGIESLESSIHSDVDDRIDMITQHWDIVTRTLTHLQAVATASLVCLLRQADISSPGPRRESHTRAPSASISIAGRRVTGDAKPFKVPKTNAKFVQLGQNCLVQIHKIHKEVDASRQRIVGGIKGLQVITGQGRWGIWREEARLAERWAGGKDKGFFFFNLLTGFLGNHTEWLQALGPDWYRRRHYQNQRSHKDDDVSVPARTIIVSNDKMAARRLIFLLSAFLPASHQITSLAHRPSTSVSLGALSQSPPTYIIPLREESLRRKINKRSSTSRAPHSRAMSFPAQSVQSSQPPKPQSETPSGLGITGHDVQRDRATSDVSQIKTANLPIPGSDGGTRKSSTATTRTATPITTVPHFSTRAPGRGTGPIPRPGSSGSLAADDLLRSLKRGDSSGQYSTVSTDSQGQNSRWGSMISGFWGSKRRPSTSTTNTSATSMEGVEINDPYYRDITSRPRGKLSNMDEEAPQVFLTQPIVQQERELRKSESGSTETARAIKHTLEQEVDEIAEQMIQVSERIPDPSGAYESPVKTSIADDGAIEIDVPLPDYLAFETAVSSPSSSGFLSTPGLGNGLEGFEHYSRAGPDSDTTINVGGYLSSYHPDFALQAVPSHSDLIAEIKESMRAEPTPAITSTPHAEHGHADRWVDVSSALVADTTSFTITHIRYRRLVKLKENVDPTTPAVSTSLESKYNNVYSAILLTPSVEVYDDHEDQFIEEQLVSMDETLIEAVERIIAQSGTGSRQSSACSSRSTSRRPVVGRERSNSDAKAIIGNGAHLEVPRNECKKMVLSALEEIVKEVAERREEELDGEGGVRREKESFLREGVRTWLGTVESVE